MEAEPAIVLTIVGSSVVFFLVLLPLIIIVTGFHQVWRANRGTAVLLAGVIFWTVLLFGTLLGTFAGLITSGSIAQ